MLSLQAPVDASGLAQHSEHAPAGPISDNPGANGLVFAQKLVACLSANLEDLPIGILARLEAARMKAMCAHCNGLVNLPSAKRGTSTPKKGS